MERTIEDSIRYFTTMRKTPQADTEMISIAIETMNKYKKIEEIVNTWRHDITAGDYHCMAEVAEVVEDDNT